jgi:hypothetical protein
MPWPSFNEMDLVTAWICSVLLRKPLWPPPAHQSLICVHAENMENWRHKGVILISSKLGCEANGCTLILLIAVSTIFLRNYKFGANFTRGDGTGFQ